MHRIKIILTKLLIAVYGFISGLYTPSILSIAFNYSHGAVNNSDGVMFIPFGIVSLLVVLIIDILLVTRTVKSNNMTKIEKIITISIFFSAKIIGLMGDQNGWKNIMCSLKEDLNN